MADWWRPWRRRRPPPGPSGLPRRPRPGSFIGSGEQAERLLWSKLTEGQQATYPDGYFDVTGSLGGQYRIYTNGTVQNITRDCSGRSPMEYCVMLAGVHYRHHVWLAQKILIESDEARFLHTAVYYPGFDPRIDPRVARQQYQRPRYATMRDW